jgi:hypothetical protein
MICIHYNDGRVLQGVVLASAGCVVRAAVKDSDDAVEFRLVSQVWVSEDCEVVRFSNPAAPAPNHQRSLRENCFHSEAQPISLQRVM